METKDLQEVGRLQNEAKWAPRGNFMVYTGNEEAELLRRLQEDPIAAYMENPLTGSSLGQKVPTYRFLHLFSGHRRDGDIEFFLIRGGAQRGWRVLVENVDLGRGSEYDLTKPEVVQRLEARIAEGAYDGGHAGRPAVLGVEQDSNLEGRHR